MIHSIQTAGLLVIMNDILSCIFAQDIHDVAMDVVRTDPHIAGIKCAIEQSVSTIIPER
jgi:hypothetical protein